MNIALKVEAAVDLDKNEYTVITSNGLGIDHYVERIKNKIKHALLGSDRNTVVINSVDVNVTLQVK